MAPLNVLPPSRGIALRVTPDVSASPSPPEVLSTSSCAAATFTMFPHWPPPPPAHPIFRPSLYVRESLPRPPWIDPAEPPPPLMPPESPLLLIPGINAWMPPADRED